MIDYLGWSATAVFVASYFCVRAEAVRRVQMIGAAMWVAYGTLMHSYPIVVANVLVLGAAAWAAARETTPRPEQATEEHGKTQTRSVS